MIKALFSIDAFVNEITSWNKKKKLLSSLINKHKFFKLIGYDLLPKNINFLKDLTTLF